MESGVLYEIKKSNYIISKHAYNIINSNDSN